MDGIFVWASPRIVLQCRKYTDIKIRYVYQSSAVHVFYNYNIFKNNLQYQKAFSLCKLYIKFELNLASKTGAK